MYNSPATFQSMMDNTFGDLIDTCLVIIYMDDIFLFEKNQKMLEENTKKVLQWLQETKPLNELLKKDRTFIWTQEC